MPYNRNREGSVYIQTGNPDTVNSSPAYAPGELGVYYDSGQRSYQIVQLDSGATAATPVGAVAANQLAFWKDKANYIVTNDMRLTMAAGYSQARNFVAGVFRTAVTPGNICHVLQRANNIPCASDGTGSSSGDFAVASASVSQAVVTPVTVGVAPTVNVIGTMRGTPIAAVVAVDLNIPSIN